MILRRTIAGYCLAIMDIQFGRRRCFPGRMRVNTQAEGGADGRAGDGGDGRVGPRSAIFAFTQSH